MKDCKKIAFTIVYVFAAFTVLMGFVGLISAYIQASCYYTGSTNVFWDGGKRGLKTLAGANMTVLFGIILFAVAMALFVLTLCWSKANAKWGKWVFCALKLACVVGGIIILVVLYSQFVECVSWVSGVNDPYNDSGKLYITSALADEYTLYVAFKSEILQIVVCLGVMLLVEYLPLLFAKKKKQEELQPISAKENNGFVDMQLTKMAENGNLGTWDEIQRRCRIMGVCQHCGCKFQGPSSKFCSFCGREKDY